MKILELVSTIGDLSALAISLWLGFYIVTRNVRNVASWLAALTLWTLSTIFLQDAFAINAPETGLWAPLRPLIVLVPVFWFHLILRLLPPRVRREVWLILILRLLPGRLQQVLRRTPYRLPQAGLVLIYGVALALATSNAFPGGLAVNGDTASGAFLDNRTSGPFYLGYILFLGALWSLCLLVLWLGRRQADNTRLRHQFSSLLLASALAGIGGLYMTLGVQWGWHVPTLPGILTVGSGVVILGFAVARYDALLEGRTFERDFNYTSLSIGALTIIYFLVTLFLYLGNHVSFVTLILVLIIAISSHSLYDGLRMTLDRLFFGGQFRQLRSILRALAQEATTRQSMTAELQAILVTLGRMLRTKKGLIALAQGDAFLVQAALNAGPVGREFPLELFLAGDIRHLSGPAPDGLQEMAVLVPLIADGRQVGTLALGEKESGQPYEEKDLDLLEDLGDQIALVMRTFQIQAENAQIIEKQVVAFREREQALQAQIQQLRSAQEEPAPTAISENEDTEFTGLVEDCLRHLHDFSYLGEHKLAQLKVVSKRCESRAESAITHIDRGKALCEILIETVGKLRPEEGKLGRYEVPAHKWRQYIILHDAYVDGELTRDIKGHLDISDGSFNRTRRKALAAVAKTLREIEDLEKR